MATALALYQSDALGFPLAERRGYLTVSERSRLPGQFGSMTAERLTSLLTQLQRGEVDQWADLVQYALKDDLLIHLYTTRLSRVAQADYQIVPNEFGDQKQARIAADFVNEMVARIENWDVFVRNALHAIALGFSANEIEWDRDGVSRVTYARNIHYVNPNRFRYDDQWKLRLYDHGIRCVSSRNQYGEPLWPANWVVHTHHELAGDPCDAGLMRMSIWRWLFRRWADTFWIQALEKHGSPWVHAEVTQGTPDAVRQSIKEALIDLNIDRAAVIEAGGKIVVTPPALSQGQSSQHEMYMDFAARSLTATWLGATDITQPGENGSQAAVSGRIGATMDPRMITDGTNFCGTLHSSLFRWLVMHNLHRFGPGVVPVPKMLFKTASDEETTDSQDLAEQNATDRDTGNAAAAALLPGSPAPYEVRGDAGSPSLDGLDGALNPQPAQLPADGSAPPPAPEGEIKKQETALNGAQVTSLIDVLTAVAENKLPRDSAAVLIQVAYQLDAATADRLLGTIGKGFVAAPPEAAAAAQAQNPTIPNGTPAPPQQPVTQATDPKAPSRPNQGRQQTRTAKTSQISSSSIGPLETVLRSISDGRER